MKQALSFLDGLARRPLLSIVLIGLLSFGGSWAYSLYRGIPAPLVLDEFSYLLQGDTFAHGRVTNPTPAMWKYFETFDTLMYPTYASIHPPAQGLFLAIGEVFFGRPIVGVWLSAGLMCSAIAWMLYAWLPARWALIGGFFGVLQFGIFTYWSQSYWGGALAATGGALIFGSLPRIFDEPRVRNTIILGVGIALILNTRPFEGLFLIPAGSLLFTWKINGTKIRTRHFFKSIVLPLSLIVLVTLMGIGAYNKKLTGNALSMPYSAYKTIYSFVPLMMWQKMGPAITYNNKEMERNENDYQLKYFLKKKTWDGFIEDMKRDYICMYQFFFGNVVSTIALGLGLIVYIRRRKILFMALIILVSSALCAVSFCYSKPHYWAPLTGLTVLVMTEGLRFLSIIRFRRFRAGLMAVVFLLAVLGVDDLISCKHQYVLSLARAIQSPVNNLPPRFTREALKNILLKSGGKYLVIVKYLPWHMYYWEWVHNDADIDHSPIVWARDRGTGGNASLLAYFNDRRVCTIEVSWDNFPGEINKAKFFKLGPEGGRILEQLINNKILEEVTPQTVRLNQDINLKKEDVLEIAGDHFDDVWRMIQFSKLKEVCNFRKTIL